MQIKVDNFERELDKGERFKFGRNWRAFLSTVDEVRIVEAVRSLSEMLEFEDLDGKSFLDAGSGSGLFSLAARRMGARVRSFDFDPQSVACTNELKARYYPNDDHWIIERGSVLDWEYMQSLGRFDVVYSWGVLHHTGNMWKAFEYIDFSVKIGGKLFLAVYNDQGWKSKMWLGLKKTYCRSFPGRILVCGVFIPYFFTRASISCVLGRKNLFRQYKKNRGMSIVHDWYDWLGGLPYEVASVDETVHFFENKDYTLTKLKKTDSLGNNQFVFAKNGEP